MGPNMADYRLVRGLSVEGESFQPDDIVDGAYLADILKPAYVRKYVENGRIVEVAGLPVEPEKPAKK